MTAGADLRIVEIDETGVNIAFREDVLKGLAESQKAIPARWFYDLRGSQLFEEITRLPEYYPTRTETALLRDNGPEIAGMAGPDRAVVEFGSGSSVKTPLLLKAMEPTAYVPIDISGEFLRQSSRELAKKFPGLPVIPVEADFMRKVDLPVRLRGGGLFGFFPGSTIGNFVPRSAIDLLRSMRNTLGENAQLLIGIDRLKQVHRLLDAYDDAEGVTAAFNLNLLHRINRELGADIPIDQFCHVARWNEEWSRIEMHLEAMKDIRFSLCGNSFSMRAGETIHTENSHKYSPRQATLLLHASGWSTLAHWTDDREDFMLILAEATQFRSAP